MEVFQCAAPLRSPHLSRGEDGPGRHSQPTRCPPRRPAPRSCGAAPCVNSTTCTGSGSGPPRVCRPDQTQHVQRFWRGLWGHARRRATSAWVLAGRAAVARVFTSRVCRCVAGAGVGVLQAPIWAAIRSAASCTVEIFSAPSSSSCSSNFSSSAIMISTVSRESAPRSENLASAATCG